MFNKQGIISSFAVKKKGIITGALVFGLLSTLSGVIIPLFIGQFYNLALHSGSTRGRIFESIFGKIEDINIFFIIFGVFLILRLLLNFFEKYYIGISGEAFSNYLRKKLFQKQLVTDLQQFEVRDTGSYLLRYSGDLKSAQDYLTKGVIQFAYDCLFILTAITLLLFVQFNLTLILLCVIPVLLLVNFMVNKKLKLITSARRNLRSRNLAFVAGRLRGILTVKTFNRESIEAEKYDKRSEELYLKGKQYYTFYAFMQALYPFIIYAALLAMLWAAYLEFNKAQSTLDGSSLITFIMLVISIIPVLRRMLKVNIIWISGDVSINKIKILFNAAEENRIREEEAKALDGDVAINNLSFNYNNKIVFKNLSVNFPVGSITHIAGSQGSGKTTLFKLLLGLYPFSEGEIKIGNENINTISKHTLRKNIVLASENLPLLGRTVFEVISYSRKDKKRKPAAAILNYLGYFSNTKLDDLDAPIKDGGRNLSAGERKLLIIARAFLTGKKYILLDEPFNDLDEATRNKVITYINNLKNKNTVIIADSNKYNVNYDYTISL